MLRSFCVITVLVACALAYGRMLAWAQAPPGQPGAVQSIVVKLPAGEQDFEALTKLKAVGAKFGPQAQEIKGAVTKARDAFAKQPSPENEAALLAAMSDGLTSLVGSYLEVAEQSGPAMAELDRAAGDVKTLKEYVAGMIVAEEKAGTEARTRKLEVEEGLRKIADRLKALGVTKANSGGIPREILTAAASLRDAVGEEDVNHANAEAQRGALEKCKDDLERASQHMLTYKQRVRRLQDQAIGAARRLGRHAQRFMVYSRARYAVHQTGGLIDSLKQSLSQLEALDKVAGIDFSLPTGPEASIPRLEDDKAMADTIDWLLRDSEGGLQGTARAGLLSGSSAERRPAKP